MRIFPGTARRPSYFDADSKLQELVEAEFDVILKNTPNGARTQKPAANRTVKDDSDAEERPLPDSLALPFSPEEESFIASSIAFLRGRPNADLLLEELWSATVSAQAPESETDGAAKDGPATQAKVAPRETPDAGNPGGPDNV
jgi:hypothetical protein